MKIVVDFLWQITECNALSGKLVKSTPFYPLCEINENWGRLLYEINENWGRPLMVDNRI